MTLPQGVLAGELETNHVAGGLHAVNSAAPDLPAPNQAECDPGNSFPGDWGQSLQPLGVAPGSVGVCN